MTDTKTLILDTAERLFAERGIQGVSVRAILSEAGVNMALAHYHFGNREGLIREVLRRRVVPHNKERLRLLAETVEAASPGKPSVEDILRAFFTPPLCLLDEAPHFARLIGHLHVTSDERIRMLYYTLFEDVMRKYADVMRDVLPPGLSGSQRLCRAHLTIGALIYTLFSYQEMELMSRGRYEVLRGDALVDELVAFCTAGLLARSPAEPEGADDDGSNDRENPENRR